jgi:tripartite-type tricarboxylate transporter receptor subunit TctC
MSLVPRRRFCTILLWLAALPALAAPEATWPSKPVKILVPGGTGGVTDLRARWLANKLSAAIGQPVIVENRPGAGGIIGIEAGVQSPPDGNTLVVVHQGTMAVNPHLYPNLSYQPLTDLAMVTRLGYGPLVLAVSPSLPVHNVEDFVRYARSKGGSLSYGSPGVGTPPHLAAELFKREANIQAVHIPYRGGGQAASDLIAGHVDFSIEGITVLGPHIKAGRVRALAVTSANRVSGLPDVPGMREAGLPGYEYIGWVGLALPAATPKPVVAQVYEAVAKVLATPEAREWFAVAGAEPGGEPPQVFSAFVREEHAKWGKVIRDSGLKAE